VRRIRFYARVSTGTQRDQNTINSQKTSMQRVLEQQGDCKSAGITDDDGISGSTFDRPGLTALLEDARAGKFDEVWVWGQDRLGRTEILDMLVWLGQFRALGIPLIDAATMKDLTSTTGTDELVTILNAWQAKNEKAQIVERTSRGKRDKVREGHFPGGVMAFGYRKDAQTKRLIPNPSEAEVVRHIFDLIANGQMSTRRASDWLNAHGFKPKEALNSSRRTSGLWTSDQVRATVRNKLYMGVLTYGRRSSTGSPTSIIEVPCEQIVSESVWTLAQGVLDSHRTFRDGPDPSKYPLRGLVKCGECGRAYVGYSAKAHRYYRCTGWGHSRPGSVCKPPAIRADSLEEAIWMRLEALIVNPGAVASFLMTDAKAVDETGTDELEAIAVAAADIKAEVRTLVRQLGTLRGTIGEAAIQERITELDAGMRTLNNERLAVLARIERAAKSHVLARSAEEVLSALRNKVDSASREVKAEVMRLLVERAVIRREEPRVICYLRVPLPDLDDSGNPVPPNALVVPQPVIRSSTSRTRTGRLPGSAACPIHTWPTSTLTR
jgi:site-specific DNA recombinase